MSTQNEQLAPQSPQKKKNWADLAYESSEEDSEPDQHSEPAAEKSQINLAPVPLKKQSQSELPSSTKKQQYNKQQYSKSNNERNYNNESGRKQNNNQKNQKRDYYDKTGKGGLKNYSSQYDPSSIIEFNYFVKGNRNEKVLRFLESKNNQENITIELRDIPYEYRTEQSIKDALTKYTLEKIQIFGEQKKCLVTLSVLEAISLNKAYGNYLKYLDFEININYLYEEIKRDFNRDNKPQEFYRENRDYKPREFNRENRDYKTNAKEYREKDLNTNRRTQQDNFHNDQPLPVIQRSTIKRKDEEEQKKPINEFNDEQTKSKDDQNSSRKALSNDDQISDEDDNYYRKQKYNNKQGYQKQDFTRNHGGGQNYRRNYNDGGDKPVYQVKDKDNSKEFQVRDKQNFDKSKDYQHRYPKKNQPYSSSAKTVYVEKKSEQNISVNVTQEQKDQSSDDSNELVQKDLNLKQEQEEKINLVQEQKVDQDDDEEEENDEQENQRKQSDSQVNQKKKKKKNKKKAVESNGNQFSKNIYSVLGK